MNIAIQEQEKVKFRDRLTKLEWRRLYAMFGVIAFLHIAGILLMFAATNGHYKLGDGTLFGWGTGILAYTLGMRHAFDAERWGHGEHLIHAGDGRDLDEILLRVVGQLRIEHGVDGLADAAHQQRVTVGGRARHQRRAQRAARAGAVIHHHLLSPGFR